MCHYITATFPGDARLEAIAALLDRHALGFERIDNPHVRGQLRPGDVQVSTTRKMCDCGTMLASRSRPEVEERTLEREVRKLRAKGWSEARIERWLAEKAMAADRAVRERGSMADGHEPEVERWLAVISEALNAGYARRFGLLVHWYSGGLESERLQLGPTQSVPLSELSATTLLEMREDALLEIRSD